MIFSFYMVLLKKWTVYSSRNLSCVKIKNECFGMCTITRGTYNPCLAVSFKT